MWNERNLQYGVPQGTILEPTMFNIYINGMFSDASRGDIFSFANDTTIFYEAITCQSLRSIVEVDFSLLKMVR